MLREGRSLRDVAAILGVSRTTLRRRLQEAGEWPVKPAEAE
jgi:transposase-like protein